MHILDDILDAGCPDCNTAWADCVCDDAAVVRLTNDEVRVIGDTAD